MELQQKGNYAKDLIKPMKLLNYIADIKRSTPAPKKYGHSVRGFTLVEILMALAVFTIIMSVVSLLAFNFSEFSVSLMRKFETQQEIQGTLSNIFYEMRPMNSSGLGAYAIAQASTSSLIFYSDIDNDGLNDQVRYFLDADIFKKGVIKPAGNPIVYNQADETFFEMVHNMSMGTSSIFTYYGAEYSGSENPLPSPINVSQIRIIKTQLTAQDQNQKKPLTFFMTITPRNLRTQ